MTQDTTSIKIGSLKDPKSLKSKLKKKAEKKKSTLHSFIVKTLENAVI